jgi:FlaA1/EpsC-like NDP-sugar epimerase
MNYLERFIRLSPRYRRFFLVVIDAFFLPLSLWFTFWLRLAQPLHPSFQAAGPWLTSAILFIGLPVFVLTGQHRGLTRYVGSKSIYRLAGRNGLVVLLLAITGLTLRLPGLIQSFKTGWVPVVA